MLSNNDVQEPFTLVSRNAIDLHGHFNDSNILMTAASFVLEICSATNKLITFVGHGIIRVFVPQFIKLGDHIY